VDIGASKPAFSITIGLQYDDISDSQIHRAIGIGYVILKCQKTQ